MLTKKKNNSALSAAAIISLLYVFLGTLWIFASDKFLYIFSLGLVSLNLKQDYLGVFYIFFSGLLFFIFTYYGVKTSYCSKEELFRVYSALDKKEGEKKLIKEKLQKIKDTSPISGLPNKRALSKSLSREIQNCAKTGLKGALYFIDLDNFKTVNDAHGHHYGDALLKKVGLEFAEVFRESYEVFHINADEYMILKKNVEFFGEVVWIAEKIKSMFDKFWEVEGNWYYLNASFGVVVFPDDGEEVDILTKNVYTALHYAKARNRGNYEIFHKSMDNEMTEKKEIEGKIKVALEEGQFQVYYQPQINIQNNTMEGAEALIRWPDGKGGFIPPSKFIPVAEESGLINPIGRWVLKSVCETNKKWQDSGFEPIIVSVNLSPRQFRDEDFLDMIKDTVNETGLDFHWLALEITEGIAMKDINYSIELLEKLREMGIQIYLDDFGTGYSSLNYLKRLPIDILKMDRDFICGIKIDSKEEAIAKTIINLGHSLDMKVNAEGVETKEQLQFLKDNGCDYVQGYIFSKPLPSDEFEKLLPSVQSPMPSA